VVAPKKKAQTFLLAKLKFDVIMILGLLLKRQNPRHGIQFPCVGFCLFFLEYMLCDILHDMKICPAITQKGE
jgi:hypothetical protein